MKKTREVTHTLSQVAGTPSGVPCTAAETPKGATNHQPDAGVPGDLNFSSGRSWIWSRFANGVSHGVPFPLGPTRPCWWCPGSLWTRSLSPLRDVCRPWPLFELPPWPRVIHDGVPTDWRKIKPSIWICFQTIDLTLICLSSGLLWNTKDHHRFNHGFTIDFPYPLVTDQKSIETAAASLRWRLPEWLGSLAWTPESRGIFTWKWQFKAELWGRDGSSLKDYTVL